MGSYDEAKYPLVISSFVFEVDDATEIAGGSNHTSVSFWTDEIPIDI